MVKKSQMRQRNLITIEAVRLANSLFSGNIEWLLGLETVRYSAHDCGVPFSEPFSFPHASETTSPSGSLGNEGPTIWGIKGRWSTLGGGYILLYGFLNGNPALKSISAAADSPRAAATRVEALKEPDKGKDEEDYGQKFEPFIGQHPREAVIRSDVNLGGGRGEFNGDISLIRDRKSVV